jgi:hypothetical protein
MIFDSSKKESPMLREFYLAERSRPVSIAQITKDRLHEYQVYTLTKPEFIISVWIKEPVSVCEESVFQYVLSAGTIMDAVRKLRAMMKRLMRRNHYVAVSLRSLEGGSISETRLDEGEKLILHSVYDGSKTQRTRKKLDLLNLALAFPIPVSNMWVTSSSSCRDWIDVEIGYVFATRLCDLDDTRIGFNVPEVLDRHFRNQLSSTEDVLTSPSCAFVPRWACETFEVWNKQVRVSDLPINRVDNLLVQLAGQQLWGKQR